MKAQTFFCAVLLLIACCGSNAQPKQAASGKIKAQDAAEQGLVYQTYGLPDLYHDKAMHEVLARYGVKMQAVAGCVVTDSLLKGVSRNNRAVFAALDKQLGPDSKARIMAEVEGVATTQRRVEEVLRKSVNVQQKEAALAKAGNGSLAFTVKPAKTANVFDVTADVLQYVSGDWKRSTWKSFMVDTLHGMMRSR